MDARSASVNDDVQDRAAGVLVGLAAGDRNGGPTRMALELAESLVEVGRFDADHVMSRYLCWFEREGFDTGPVAGRVFELVLAGAEPVAAVDTTHGESGGRTAGCNPAHRVPPLASAAFVPDDALAECARLDAALTHRDRLAGDVAASVVQLCRSLITGRPWGEALRDAGAPVPTAGDRPLRRGGFAPEVLRAAIAFLHVPAGTPAAAFGAALSAAIGFAGPDNYCPVLVGTIGGARWGTSAVSDDLLAHAAPVLPDVHRVARCLGATWQ